MNSTYLSWSVLYSHVLGFQDTINCQVIDCRRLVLNLMNFWESFVKTTTGPTPPKMRDLAGENEWLRTSRGQQMVNKKGSVLSTSSTADNQTPTIHTGRSIYHVTKVSDKHFVLGCTSSDTTLNFQPIAAASAALCWITALENIEVHKNTHHSPKSAKMLIILCKEHWDSTVQVILWQKGWNSIPQWKKS